MQLYYESPGVQLWRGDCRQAHEVVGLQRFSLILADPPYRRTSLPWDRWPTGWLAAVKALRAQDGSLWSWGTLSVFMERAAEFIKAGWGLPTQDCIWEKHNVSQPVVGRFARVHEQVAQFYPPEVAWGSLYRDPQKVPAPPEHAHKKGRVVLRTAQPAHTGKYKPSTYVDTGMRFQRSVWPVRSMHRQGAGVATPKPPGVLEPIIRYSCPPGGWVLVPFAGGGAEMEAAARLGRNVCGFDLDEASLAVAAARLRTLAAR